MHPNPLVSEFSLEPRPSNQQLLCKPDLHQANSRMREASVPIFSRSAMGPTQILINVKHPKATTNNTQSEMPAGGIRQDIDACLQAIELAYSKKDDKAQQNFIPSIEQSSLKEQAIHRIDGNLVMDYVATVYRDYRIRNRFGDFHPANLKQKNNQRKQQVMMKEFSKQGEQVNHVLETRFVQVMPRQERVNSFSRQSKKFLNVTQQSKLPKREASFSSQKKDRSIMDSKKQHRQTYSFHDSPAIPQALSTRIGLNSVKKSTLIGRVREDFRYCVNCQKPILTLNVDFHEQYECSNFQQLYGLSFKALLELVEGKTARMKEELRGMLIVLKDRQRRENAQQLTANMLQLMEDYLRQQCLEVHTLKDQIREEQRKLKYNIIKETENNLYSQAIELTHKLHWFQSIANRLRRQMEVMQESATKNEQGKAINYIRSLTTPTQKQSHSELSPVAYLHPHLHRLRHT